MEHIFREKTKLLARVWRVRGQIETLRHGLDERKGDVLSAVDFLSGGKPRPIFRSDCGKEESRQP
jgi:hypothetical protein